MGHITLSIRQNNRIQPYIIVDADYLHEAWVAEAHDDNSTKIIRQFKCEKFNDCFEELRSVITDLGEVTEISANDIPDTGVKAFKNMLAAPDKEQPKNHHSISETFKKIQKLLTSPAMAH
jgi:hypothetical protein